MTLIWRRVGEPMGTIDLGQIDQNEVVIHFGGELRSVNAYTFANSLLAISDTIRAINNSIDPNRSIEIRVEALGPGSFRAKIRKTVKGVKDLVGRASFDIVIGLLGALIYDAYINQGGPLEIRHTEDSYIIEHDGDTIILPREVYEQLPNIRENPEVRRNLQRTFQTLG